MGQRARRLTGVGAAACALALVVLVAVTPFGQATTATTSTTASAPSVQGTAAPVTAAAEGVAPTTAPAPEVATTVVPVPVETAPPLPAYDAADTAAGWQQRKGEAALALIPLPWEEIGFRIKFMGARSGYRAGTFPHEKLIEVYVRQELSLDEIARDIAHELGHAFDWERNNASVRATYKQVRGYGDRPGGWFACSGCTDFATPAGDFAETFAYWALGARLEHRGVIVPAPTPEQLALLEPLFTI